MLDELISSVKNSSIKSFEYLDALDDSTKALMYGLFLILVFLPFIWLFIRNFGKIVVFLIATIGVLVLIGFIALWTGFLSSVL